MTENPRAEIVRVLLERDGDEHHYVIQPADWLRLYDKEGAAPLLHGAADELLALADEFGPHPDETDPVVQLVPPTRTDNDDEGDDDDAA